VYPPTPYLEETGSEICHEDGPGPRPARELNPRVSPELDAVISRLLAWAPEERFNGHARQAAEALEEVAQRARSLAAHPLFVWGYEQNPCESSAEAVQLAAPQGESMPKLARALPEKPLLGQRGCVWPR
jgi:eukaryotic-like serine/threonine-protein kinase